MTDKIEFTGDDAALLDPKGPWANFDITQEEVLVESMLPPDDEAPVGSETGRMLAIVTDTIAE